MSHITRSNTQQTIHRRVIMAEHGYQLLPKGDHELWHLRWGSLFSCRLSAPEIPIHRARWVFLHQTQSNTVTTRAIRRQTHTLAKATTTGANASLISMTSMSSMVKPAFLRACTYTGIAQVNVYKVQRANARATRIDEICWPFALREWLHPTLSPGHFRQPGTNISHHKQQI